VTSQQFDFAGDYACPTYGLRGGDALLSFRTSRGYGTPQAYTLVSGTGSPFTSDLSGQDFAKLILAGAVPISLVLGISIGVRHDDGLTKGQIRWAVGNVEVSGYTELVNRTRRDARNELMLDVGRISGHGVVIQRSELHLAEQECRGLDGARDHRAEVTMVGTAITQLHHGPPGIGAAEPAGAVTGPRAAPGRQSQACLERSRTESHRAIRGSA